MIRFNSRLPALVSWFFPVAAITIGPIVFVRARQASPELIRHELIHVAQGKELLFVGFWILYLAFFLRYLVELRDPVKAYRSIPFELEARAYEGRLHYIRTRPRFNWRHFIV